MEISLVNFDIIKQVRLSVVIIYQGVSLVTNSKLISFADQTSCENSEWLWFLHSLFIAYAKQSRRTTKIFVTTLK